MCRERDARLAQLEQLDFRVSTFLRRHPRQAALLTLGLILLGAALGGLLALAWKP